MKVIRNNHKQILKKPHMKLIKDQKIHSILQNIRVKHKCEIHKYLLFVTLGSGIVVEVPLLFNHLEYQPYL